MGSNNKGGLLGASDQLRIPDAPTISATAGNTQIEVAFTNPSDVGGSAISSYTAIAQEGGNATTASGSTTPVTITGLSNGTSYSVTGTANNDFGASFQSSASSVTPIAPFGGGTAGLFYGGEGQIVHGITIASTGNAEDFGDPHSNNVYYGGSCASSTRAVFVGGANGSVWDIIEYYTFATKGNGTDFGDMTVAAYGLNNGLVSNSTRGVYQFGRHYFGGYAYDNRIEYITIASPGNATDFGDMGTLKFWGAGCTSTTRGIFAGGTNDGSLSSATTNISYITIASTGNSTNFGSLNDIYGLVNFTGASSNTRGIFFGGRNDNTGSGGGRDAMLYITIASTGNSSDFGDLSSASRFNAATGSSTRAVCAIGSNGSSNVNTLEYVTIASTGNATDFGDLTSHFNGGAAASQVHGGLS
tara:strand:+ start:76 stop:1320 length:1245 start_codon:yes stop_codon:yes gene_type:complete